MSYEDIWKREQERQTAEKRKPGHTESNLQQDCVRWFRLQYPKLAMLLFAVPNGGKRSRRTYVNKYGSLVTYSPEAKAMNREGVTAGVSDLILLKPAGPFASLCIEMKTMERQQTERKPASMATGRRGSRK